MPEYLAPGVYVEETSFRAKSIEGVGTSTTAFIGPTRRGPLASASKDATGSPPPPPEMLTSFVDFTRIYGGVENLSFSGKSVPNYVALAVLNFFNEGGSRLYVARVAKDAKPASLKLGKDGDNEKRVVFTARSAGSGGKVTVTIQETTKPLNKDAREKAKAGTLARVVREASDVVAGLYLKKADAAESDWVDATDETKKLDLAKLDASNQTLESIALNLSVEDGEGSENNYENVSLRKEDERFVSKMLPERPARRADQITALVSAKVENDPAPRELYRLLLGGDVKQTSAAHKLIADGDDGDEPELGEPTTAGTYAAAFEQLRGLEDVSIVAAPGHTAFKTPDAITKALIGHVEAQRAYRIAVLDTPPKILPSEAREFRSRFDSHRAALYYPWVTVANPLARPGREGAENEINVPPSGLICGIYARNDVEKSVSKAPANEVVRSALRFESDINFAQNQLLNPLGVNCLRFFPGRGYRVWGARTTSSDPEWKYVNVRRYFLYLEHSIDNGTQWAVFENNGERLWANVRETIESFLYNEWVSGNLLGSSPKEAYFVRCDRSTMTQNDLDNGRLVCLIGVAVLKPAEFVIFRIGQKTADSRS